MLVGELGLRLLQRLSVGGKAHRVVGVGVSENGLLPTCVG